MSAHNGEWSADDHNLLQQIKWKLDTVSAQTAGCSSQVEGLRSDLTRKMEDLRREIKDDFVTKIEYQPVSRAMYGLVGLILLAVIGAWMTAVLR